MFVEAFVSEPAAEAFHEPVLLRLAGGNVVPQHRPFLLSAQDRMRCQLRPIVADSRRRIAAGPGNPVQLPPDPQAGQRRVHHEAQALAVKSSTNASARNRRPLPRASDTKSSDQRWFWPFGKVIGNRVPSARFRPPRLPRQQDI